MKKLLGIALFALSFGLANASFAHGEEELGPHNGYIQMPGAYHVELIPHKDSIEIMLLDINFNDPMTANSQVKVKLKRGKFITVLTCTAKENSFICPLKENMLDAKGTIYVESKRDKSEGMKVEYALPLQIKK